MSDNTPQQPVSGAAEATRKEGSLIRAPQSKAFLQIKNYTKFSTTFMAG